LLARRRREAARAFLAGYRSGASLTPQELRLCRLAAALRIRRHLPAGAPAARRRQLLAEALGA
jgi:Ser/Thr protein kinase RdoA (MazF antagonist)